MNQRHSQIAAGSRVVQTHQLVPSLTSRDIERGTIRMRQRSADENISMRNSVFLMVLSGALPAFAALNVPITVQEAIYPGSTSGISRTNEPFCQGIPIADSAAIGSTGNLTLTGATAGQFRILGRWPSGNAKWIEVCGIVSSLAAGGTTTVTLRDSGSGNFGGANLATDNGATITVATGAATFTVRKARFNVVDQVVVGATAVVATNTSQGLVITGPPASAPYPANVTCTAGSCTVPYLSTNDTSSTCVIEKNGPVEAVLKCDGNHVDASGNVYLHFTVREYFHAGKTAVKVTSILRNADYGTSNTFATAYKGHQGYELRIAPNISGTTNFSFGNEGASPTTGTLTGADSVYVYQGETQKMKWQDWCGYLCVPFTTDSGYSIKKNGSTLQSGANTEGWADISNTSGAGIEVGVYQMAAYWPKSLEFNAGGTDVRIGIWARQNSQPYYQAWPQWSVHDLYLNFHAAALASPANEFLKLQHYLVARASIAHYNSTKVFPYNLIDGATEDAFYASTTATANPGLSSSSGCCIGDVGTADTFRSPLNVYRFYSWRSGGGANQTEFRWSYLLNFLTRGMTGRYLDASHFYRMQTETTWPHSDGFNWRDRPHANQSSPELDGFGFPKATSANSSLAISQNWLDQEHGHWYGLTDYYFMSGDETAHDTLLDGVKDQFLNMDTYQAGSAGGLYNSRAIGVQLIGAARFGQFLADTGDPDTAGALAQGANVYSVQVAPDLCVSGYPNGCSVGQIDANLGGFWTTQGVSRVRGVPWGSAGTSGSWCEQPHAYRVNSSFQPAILIQGLLEYRNVRGPEWGGYDDALDLAYGIAQWNLSENFVDNGSGRWDVNGFRFGIALDRENNCSGPGESPEPNFKPTATQTTTMTFIAKYLVDGNTAWAGKFKMALQKLMASVGSTASDLGSFQLAHAISIINNPGTTTLNTLPITGFVNNGGGNYTLSWTVPAGAQRYRIKWGSKTIVDWIGFDPATNVFLGNPATTMPWFAAPNVPDLPSPAGAGSTQSLTISTGVSGLVASNFSVRAYVAGGGGGGGGGLAANLVMVSGNGQSGTVGTALPSPLTVMVTDTNGSGVSGTLVSFSVIGGGGSLSTSSATTNGLGLASVTLTLGPSTGSNTVTATSAGLAGSPAAFTATGTLAGPGPATNLVLVSGSGQTGTVGTTLPTPLTVKVTDAIGTGVPGVVIAFSITAGGGNLSAASVTTNSSGLASTTLTLGSAAGTNTVRAASGILSGSPLFFSATATAASSGGANVTWTKQSITSGWPSYVGWLTLHYDSISQQTMIFGGPQGAHGIYSTDIYAYNAAANAFTRISGTGSDQNACPADTPTRPGDRHPVGQMAIDTKRNVLWLFGGVNAYCSAPSGPDANPRQDMYFLSLNNNVTSNTWNQVNPAHFPAANGSSAMIYDPDDDVLFAFGSDSSSQTRDNWVYCRTGENPTPGTLTAQQSAAGCSTPDDWTQVNPVGGVQPPAVAFPGMVYDTVTKKVLLFGGMSSGLTIPYNETWAYDVPARRWTQKALGTTPPPPYNGSNVAQPALAYNSSTKKVLYHQTSNSGAPADWQYDPVADTWTKLVSSGGGAAYDQFMTYDAARNRLIGYNLDTISGEVEVWHGALSSAVLTSPCDLNADGATNILDVILGNNQIGNASCGSADLDGNSSCTEADVQRIVDASFGLACRTGP